MSNPDTPFAPRPDADTLARGQRAWLGALQVVLVLPFAVTKDCGNGAVAEFTGLDYYFGAERWGFLVALVLVVGTLAIWPWRGARADRAVAAVGLRAWVATLGALVAIFGPFLAFLFEAPSPRIGWWLHGGGWALTALGYLGLTGALLVGGRGGGVVARAGGPERVGTVVLLVAPVAAVLLRLVVEPFDSLGAAIVGYALTLPLALAGLALTRGLRRGEPMRPVRALWWLATVVTLLGHVAAGLAE